MEDDNQRFGVVYDFEPLDVLESLIAKGIILSVVLGEDLIVRSLFSVLIFGCPFCLIMTLITYCLRFSNIS